MNFKPIDLSAWKRSQVFHYFSETAPTGYSLTADVDISHLKKVLKEAGLKFYPAYLWLVTRNLNHQEEFRTAVCDGILGYYDVLTPLYAVFHDDDKTFSMMWTEYSENFSEFYHNCIENQRKYGDVHGFLSRPELPPPNAYTVSCMPWVKFTHFAVHSYNKPYYFPSLESGKYYEKSRRIMLPL